MEDLKEIDSKLKELHSLDQKDFSVVEGFEDLWEEQLLELENKLVEAPFPKPGTVPSYFPEDGIWFNKGDVSHPSIELTEKDEEELKKLE